MRDKGGSKLRHNGLGDEVLDYLRKLSSDEPRLGDKRSLGPMMSRPLDVALTAFVEFIDRNLNDPVRFRITNSLAEEVISVMNDLLSNAGGSGLITYGGSESNLTALYIARELGYRTVITSAAAHTSVFKSAKVLSMKILTAGVDNSLHIIVDDVKRLWRDSSDSVIVLTAGNTETGVIDDVEGVSDVVPDAPIVIDGAFGGLIAPFLRDAGLRLGRADFSINNVISVGVDGHKALLTPIPSGALLLRDKELLDKVTFRSSYLSSNNQVGLLWSRTGGSAAALWASLNYFGYDGLKNLYMELMRRTLWLRDSLSSLGFEVIEPELPIVCFRHSEIGSLRIQEFLNLRGWYLYKCPTVGGLRVTLLPHVTYEVLEEFLNDLKEAIAGFKS